MMSDYRFYCLACDCYWPPQLVLRETCPRCRGDLLFPLRYPPMVINAQPNSSNP